MASSARFSGRMAASDADRVLRQALACLPVAHLEAALASLTSVSLAGAVASDRSRVLHTVGLVEDALALAHYSASVRSAFAGA